MWLGSWDFKPYHRTVWSSRLRKSRKQRCVKLNLSVKQSETEVMVKLASDGTHKLGDPQHPHITTYRPVTKYNTNFTLGYGVKAPQRGVCPPATRCHFIYMITLLSQVDSFQNAKPILQRIRIEAILGNNKFTYISLFIHRWIRLVYPLHNQSRSNIFLLVF